MKYYFTNWSGEDCSQGEYPKGWFDISGRAASCLDIFTNKRERDKARRVRLKAYITELKQMLKEVGK